MMATAEKKEFKAGGSFLVETHDLADIFTPEEFTEEDLMMAQTVDEFMEKEVVPRAKELALGRNEDMKALLKKCGELGFLGAEVPEIYGGMELRKHVGQLLGELTIKDAGFAVSLGAHCGIGTMPITYFGNEEQKQRYLPRLATGEILAAYALTEASSGSDAMNAKTRAVLSEDGTHYILNGSKMWISNAGFADIFVVFAKIDGTDFTAFIVERAWDGVSLGAEEKKMGIKSSSTRAVNFENVKVPVENLLGNRGEGHKIAFNILNIGRFKLGGACVGGSKQVIKMAAGYAVERQAFGKSISEFGLIKQKLAEMAVLTFAQESMVYRTAGYIDKILQDVKFGQEGAEGKILKGVEEYAIECAMAKVYCTEAMDHIADEAVQIYGGYGYSQEYAVERIYRDVRVNRIFEGTNEINRLLIVDMLLKRAMKGKIPLIQKAQELMGELMGMPSFHFVEDSGLLAEERKMTENAKKVAVFLAGAGVRKFMDGLTEQQELLGMAADLFTYAYVMESMVLRTLKKAERDGEEAAALMASMTAVYCSRAMEQVGVIARTALPAVEEGDTLLTMMAALRRLTKIKPLNTVALNRQIAAAVVADQAYPI